MSGINKTLLKIFKDFKEKERRLDLKLAKSRRLRDDLLLAEGSADAFIEDLLDLFISESGLQRVNRTKYTRGLRLILGNVLSGYSIDPDMFIAYGRSKRWYQLPPRYGIKPVKYDIIVRLINWLVENNLLEHHEGSKRKKRMSRFRAMPHLLKVLYQVLEPNDPTTLSCSQTESIRLKDQKKRLVDYKDTITTKRMRAQMDEINRNLSAVDLTMGGRPLPPQRMYRVFNRTFKLGGRLYGAEFHSAKKVVRKTITINGEATKELDYSRLHITIVYANAGRPCEGDAYEIPGYDPDIWGDISKRAVNICLNAGSKQEALGGLWKKYPHVDKKELSVLVHAVLAKHKLIEDYFFEGVGLKLQRIDSEIALKILLKYLRRKNPIVILPVHDSFICPVSIEDDLSMAMKREFFKRFKVQIDVK